MKLAQKTGTLVKLYLRRVTAMVQITFNSILTHIILKCWMTQLTASTIDVSITITRMMISLSAVVRVVSALISFLGGIKLTHIGNSNSMVPSKKIESQFTNRVFRFTRDILVGPKVYVFQRETFQSPYVCISLRANFWFLRNEPRN